MTNYLDEVTKNGRIEGDPGPWGLLLIDAIRHIAEAHHEMLEGFAARGEGPVPPPLEKVLERIMEVLLAEHDKPTIETKGNLVTVEEKPEKKD